MTNKQPEIRKMTSMPDRDLLTSTLRTTTASCRINSLKYTTQLRSLSEESTISINEKKFRTDMYLYRKHVSTCFSKDACLRFIGYYNLNKVKYYLGSFQGKGMIELAEVIKGYNRYRLAPLGISAVNDINESFERCLYDWFNKYGICL